MTVQPAGGPASSGLADVIDTILDKGLVIDAYARVSLIGIEVLAVEARVVVSSVDTYLRFAEAMSHLEEEMEERAPAEQVEREPLRGEIEREPQERELTGTAEELQAEELRPEQAEERARVRRRRREED